jgi:lipopolysaccharide biosynthesis protein
MNITALSRWMRARIDRSWATRRQHLIAGNRARDRGDWTSAALRYRLFLGATPGNFAVWVQLGHALKESGQLAEAAVAYGAALEINSEDADLHLSLGHLQKRQGLFSDAITSYMRSVALDGNADARDELRRMGVDVEVAATLQRDGGPSRGATDDALHTALTVGAFEGLDGALARGWVWDPRSPMTPAAVDFIIDGEVVHTCRAEQQREDVLLSGFGGGLAGFNAELPLSSILPPDAYGREVRLHARLCGTSIELQGSPRQLTLLRDRDIAARVVGVPHPSASRLLRPPVRAIAYYLPQFHPFPENDRWWGRGFTEWTNVTRATPQYEGHYQPHRPGELGYYDLRVAEVQERQAELARIYGIHGFCFYFYWFSGRTLMERPISAFADNKNIDLPFCLCWANENWTRRWDGLDSDVLISQKYSAEDDLAFMERVSAYLRRQNYIRICGKPVLSVYRAELLPDPLATTRRWRDYCRSIGIGEIFLVCSQSFSEIDPRTIGFDAAVEFPPNDKNVRTLSLGKAKVGSHFRGTLFDYGHFLEMARTPVATDYKLLRGVFTSWDNTARRQSRGTIFPNAGPEGYREYLEAVCDDLLGGDSRPPDDRVVFINAWNEWAEGAHLEPDERYGYAYLEATRMAQVRAAARVGSVQRERFGAPSERPCLAVVVHAYYLEVAEELLPLFAAYPEDTEFFFTTVAEQKDQLAQQLARLPHRVTIYATENRGRDVAPFLEVLQRIWSRRFKFILKLHTKRSQHRTDGDQWRAEIIRSIGDPGQLPAIIEELERQPSIGILGSADHLVRMSKFWGSNAERVRQLGRRLGFHEIDEGGVVFVAGTMFFARLEALEPLLALSLAPEDFEPEAGQTDGTLAHAIERAFSLSAAAASLGVSGVRTGRDGRPIVSGAAATSFAYAESALPDWSDAGRVHTDQL